MWALSFVGKRKPFGLGYYPSWRYLSGSTALTGNLSLIAARWAPAVWVAVYALFQSCFRSRDPSERMCGLALTA